jgi:RNA polymerase sigma-70 factor (ECF subfamily)
MHDMPERIAAPPSPPSSPPPPSPVAPSPVAPSPRRPAAPTDVGTLTPGDFESLLVAILPAAFGYALRLTRNRADAEDLVQDASLLAFRSSRTFEPGTNFRAWFFTILTRAFWARQRRQRRRPATVELEEAPDLVLYSRSAAAGLPWEGEDPASRLIDRLGSERVTDAVARLPEAYGVVCTLYFMEDFAYHEIAGVLGIPVGTVRSRLHRGRRMLQQLLWREAEECGIVRELAPPEAAP